MRLQRRYLAGLSAAVMIATAGLSNLAFSQDGDAPHRNATAEALAEQGYKPYPDHVQPQAHYAHQRRSVVHHYPYPYPEYYHGDEHAGFRNPGGRGRYAEYYAPGDEQRLQAARDPVQRAKFDQGGGAPDRAEQIAAYNAGTQRYNSIQRSIDSYARPYYGYGFGVGGFGGFW